MRQILPFGGAGSSSVTTQWRTFGAYQDDWGTGVRRQLVPIPGVIKNLYIQTASTQKNAVGQNYRIMIAGTTRTSVLTTLTGSTLQSGNLMEGRRLVAGNEINLAGSIIGAPYRTSTMGCVEFIPDNNNLSTIQGGIGGNMIATGDLNVLPMVAWGAGATTSVLNSRICVMPKAATLKNFYLSINGTPGSAVGYFVSLYKNGVQEATTVASLCGGTTSRDLAINLSVAQGDTLEVVASALAGTPVRRLGYGVSLDMNSDKEFIFAGGLLTPQTNSFLSLNGLTATGLGTNYLPASQILSGKGPTKIKNLTVKSQRAPAGTAGREFVIFKNGVATLLKASIVGAATLGINNTDEVEFNEWDMCALKVSIIAGSPSYASTMTWSVVAEKPEGNTPNQLLSVGV